jgi:glycosyltransferase involved in cell wall biosynthesis
MRRVVLAHWSFPPTTGGVESHLSDLAVTLSRAGCAVTVLTGEPRPRVGSGYQVVTTPLLNLAEIRAAGARDNTPALEAFLTAFLEDVRPDVVHGHNLHHFWSGPAALLGRLRRKFGFGLHHTFHETWPDILHRDPPYRDWTANYAVSEFVRQGCARWLGFAPELRPLGVDVSRFRPAPRGGGGPTVLHPARLLPWKGVRLSLEMLAQLRRSGLDARLILTDTQTIVDWDRQLSAYRAEILAFIGEAKLDGVVELRPATYDEMPGLYREADVVVYPTIGDEPYGLVPLEAMSSGRPIVASRSGGMTETIVDGTTGFIVRRGDVTELTERVGQLLRAPARRHRMGQAARRHVVYRFGLAAYVDGLLRRYQES